MRERSRARGWALQALYAWETRGAGDEMLIPILDEMAQHLRVSPKNRLYADVLVRLVSQNLRRIDQLLQEHLTNWSLNRLSVLDRNILRLGAAEMLYVDDVPPRVTIREMIRLGELYSSPESPRFVNGVLDAVMRDLAAEGSAGGQ